MPIVDNDTYDTLSSAIGSPEDYSSGANRKKLRAALDIASSQIAKHVFGFEAENRMMLRRKLNKIKEEEIAEKYRELVEALKEVLNSSEPVHRKGYGEDDEQETQAFIESHLPTLIQCLDELD